MNNEALVRMAISSEQQAIAMYGFIASKTDNPDIRAWAIDKKAGEQEDLDDAKAQYARVRTVKPLPPYKAPQKRF